MRVVSWIIEGHRDSYAYLHVVILELTFQLNDKRNNLGSQLKLKGGRALGCNPSAQEEEQEALESKPAWLRGLQGMWKRENEAPFYEYLR